MLQKASGDYYCTVCCHDETEIIIVGRALEQLRSTLITRSAGNGIRAVLVTVSALVALWRSATKELLCEGLKNAVCKAKDLGILNVSNQIYTSTPPYAFMA
jgi:hypothetical protein